MVRCVEHSVLLNRGLRLLALYGSCGEEEGDGARVVVRTIKLFGVVVV